MEVIIDGIKYVPDKLGNLEQPIDVLGILRYSDTPPMVKYPQTWICFDGENNIYFAKDGVWVKVMNTTTFWGG